MCFRVGRLHFFNWKSEDVPRESTSFETQCRKVVQILTSGNRPISSSMVCFYFLFVFLKHQKRRIVLWKSILVGLQRSIFGLPSSTLSQKMCFRVGRPQLFNWKSEDVPHENTSFEIKCRKVVQIWTFFCRKPRVSTQTPIGIEARNHHHHQREKERARESKTKKESERERERGEGEKGSQSLYT